MEDGELVVRILEGERNLFRLLVTRHQSRIYYLGRKFFRRPEDAEDFVQEVFFRCFQKLESYSGKAPFPAWLYRLAYNLALNTRRFQKRMREDFFPAFDGHESGNETPEQVYCMEESKEELNRALAEMGGFPAFLVRLYYYEGMDYRRIAEITDMPIGTLKSHLHRIRKSLRARLEETKGLGEG
jgi:RNA polymerase sigma-70 factor (ECF subfamily)